MFDCLCKSIERGNWRIGVVRIESLTRIARIATNYEYNKKYKEWKYGTENIRFEE